METEASRLVKYVGYSHTFPVEELLTVTTAEYDPEQEFHLSFSFSEAFGLFQAHRFASGELGLCQDS